MIIAHDFWNINYFFFVVVERNFSFIGGEKQKPERE